MVTAGAGESISSGYSIATMIPSNKGGTSGTRSLRTEYLPRLS
jgi:hypothetical protein